MGARLRWVRGLRRSAPAVATAPPPAAHRFLLWWLLLPFAVFLASTSRLPLYLLVLAPPAALLLACALPQDALACARPDPARGLVLLVAAKGAGALHETSRDGRRLAAALSETCRTRRSRSSSSTARPGTAWRSHGGPRSSRWTSRARPARRGQLRPV
ncbi:MAG: hypothetical protein R2862_13110 [Thermoanaerobaculia bacterium]